MKGCKVESTRQLSLRFLKLGLGLVILLLLIRGANWSEILNSLASVDIGWFALSLVLFPLYLVIKNYKWLLLLEKSHEVRDFHFYLKSYVKSLVYGAVTPGRVGELSRSYVAKLRGHATHSAVASVVYDRLTDLIFLIAFAGLGIIALPLKGEFTGQLIPLISICFLFVSTLIFLMNKVSVQELFAKLLTRNLQFEPYKVPGKVQLSALLLTFVAFVIKFLNYWLLAKSLGLSIDYVTVICIIAPTLVAWSLPISVLGVGTRDAVLVWYFHFLGLDQNLALAFSSLILFREILTLVLGYIYSCYPGTTAWKRNTAKA